MSVVTLFEAGRNSLSRFLRRVERTSVNEGARDFHGLLWLGRKVTGTSPNGQLAIPRVARGHFDSGDTRRPRLPQSPAYICLRMS